MGSAEAAVARTLTLRLTAFLVVVLAVWVPKAFWPAAPLYTAVFTPERLGLAASALKLLALGSGAFLAWRSANHLGPDNPARAPWRMLSAFLASFAAGQLVLSAYEARHVQPPLPSVGDGFFVVGYAMMIPAAARFVRVYRATGFPLGHKHADAILTAVASVCFLVFGVPFLWPIAVGSGPLPERAINVLYPVLDFVAFVPTLMLVRIAWHFRGGKVWTVWAALSAGLIFAFVGDFAFASWASAGGQVLEDLIDPLLIASYALLASGAARQDALVRDDPG
ncbi:MAG TPA: hypothetical protein VGI39_13305 [Polyangiaceae bacterium]|jgi:hypothetical protein